MEKELSNVELRILGCGNSVGIVHVNVSAVLVDTTRDEAIRIFTDTWDERVEPLREGMTKISRQVEADGNEDVCSVSCVSCEPCD